MQRQQATQKAPTICDGGTDPVHIPCIIAPLPGPELREEVQHCGDGAASEHVSYVYVQGLGVGAIKQIAGL